MHIGYFAQPAHPPERDLSDAIEWDLQTIRWAEEFGFAEYWMGSHYTVPWLPIPSPDLVLAQGIRETERIRLGTGGFVLPYHHPIELAHRVAQLDHMSKGRFNLGVAASSIPTDWAAFNVDGIGGEQRRRFAESLDIMTRYWAADGPMHFEGEFWSFNYPEPMLDGMFGPHLKPLQDPHPPIGIAGLSPRSETLVMAGSLGMIPMSLNIAASYLATHWESYEKGASDGSRTADRSMWRLVKEVFIADTDSEAERLMKEGGTGDYVNRYFLPQLRAANFIELLKVDPSHSDDEVDLDYLIRHHFLVGSPTTVIEKIQAMYDVTGGFGTLLVYGIDNAQNPEAWRTSMELLGGEVLPKLEGLGTARTGR